ncbi:hypothetical protein TgHK011_005810 [Trichoderma gracile]|nr:hypothetical protein TgHK011_005810 [Trichoderma gracile]
MLLASGVRSQRVQTAAPYETRVRGADRSTASSQQPLVHQEPRTQPSGVCVVGRGRWISGYVCDAECEDASAAWLVVELVPCPALLRDRETLPVAPLTAEVNANANANGGAGADADADAAADSGNADAGAAAAADAGADADADVDAPARRPHREANDDGSNSMSPQPQQTLSCSTSRMKVKDGEAQTRRTDAGEGVLPPGAEDVVEATADKGSRS